MRPGWIGIAACVAGLWMGGSSGAQDAPRFRTGVDVLPADVIAVDGGGRLVTDLAPEEFVVTVNGERRRVLAAEWVSLLGPQRPPADERPDGYSANTDAPLGRLIVLAVDQPNIRFGGGRAVTAAVASFIDRLAPGDRLAFVALGRGSPPIPFTGDHGRVKQALASVNGQMQTRAQTPIMGFTLALSDAVALERGEVGALEQLVRECMQFERPNDSPFSIAQYRRQECEQEIRREATDLLQTAVEERDRSIAALAQLLNSLTSIDAHKTLVLVSEGFATFENDGDVESRLAVLARLAAAARTTIYGLRLGDQLFDVTRRARPLATAADPFIRTRALEQLTRATRGLLFTATTTGSGALERIDSESAGYYQLGIESGPGDSAATLAFGVEAERAGVTVRARSSIAAPDRTSDGTLQASIRAAAAALTMPVTLSSLPLRMTTFSLRGPDPSSIRVLIHADVGESYSDALTVALALRISDENGRLIDSQSVSQRLSPRAGGLPTPLPFVATASLAPGEYVVKLAASVGERVGTVEHSFHASLIGVPDAVAARGRAEPERLALSDLVLGASVSEAGTTPPVADPIVRFGVVQGYIEAYGIGSDSVAVQYEVARDDRAPALLTTRVEGRAVDPSYAVFSKTVSVGALPPGRYRLRAVVRTAGANAAIVSRGFEIAPPRNAGMAANTPPAAAAGPPPHSADRNSELFLPVESGELVEPFSLDEALRSETLDAFASMVPAGVKSDFDGGVDHLRSRRYEQAQASFKRAIRPNVDFTGPLAYLAVAFAASDHHLEAANAWQTALIGRGDVPQLYLWLGGALLRAREFARAQQILQEGAERWPDEVRFARPLAMLYATTGRGFEAFELLQRHLTANDSDARALYRAVQWIYHLHLNGIVWSDRAADLAQARAYADAYARVNGANLPVVREWIGYLEQSR
jgi:VWFA-related protein